MEAGSAAGVDHVKAELVRRDVAQRILDRSGDAGDVPLGRATLARTSTPKVDYMATIRHAVRKALRESTLGRYDRTFGGHTGLRRRLHHADVPSPRPARAFSSTSASMQDTQLARAVAELGGLTRQLGYGAEIIVCCCDTAVHEVKRVFSTAQLALCGGGGTDLATASRCFDERNAVDLLVVVSDCHRVAGRRPAFRAHHRVGDGPPPPWGTRGANRVITIDEPSPR